VTSASADFLAERLQGIGGSDVASLFNVGWGCRRRLWLQKRATPETDPREDNLAMRLGKVLEPFFAARYVEETKRTVNYWPDLFVHPVHKFLIGHIDRFLHSGGPLEIKSVGRAAFFKYKRSGLPEDYILQLQHYMLVTETQQGAFCIGNRDSGDILYWDVERDEGICDSIKEQAGIFWDAMPGDMSLNGKLSPDDLRCHNCSYRFHCHGSGPVFRNETSEYLPGPDVTDLTREYMERKALEKEAKALVEEARQELETKLGDRTMVDAGCARIQFYSIRKKEYTVKAHTERPLRIYEVKK
jgi:putative phage-type endonuclease